MRIYLPTCILLANTLIVSAGNIDNQSIFRISKEEARATVISYENQEKARKAVREELRYYLSLNGEWEFKWLERTDSVEYFRNSSELGGIIDVPSTQETEGYGPLIFLNWDLPFKYDPPHVPEKNPVGIYRKTFTIPRSWKEREIFIHFAGVSSALEL